jgi:hypothetical protein
MKYKPQAAGLGSRNAAATVKKDGSGAVGLEQSTHATRHK